MTIGEEKENNKKMGKEEEGKEEEEDTEQNDGGGGRRERGVGGTIRERDAVLNRLVDEETAKRQEALSHHLHLRTHLVL